MKEFAFATFIALSPAQFLAPSPPSVEETLKLFQLIDAQRNALTDRDQTIDKLQHQIDALRAKTNCV